MCVICDHGGWLSTNTFVQPIAKNALTILVNLSGDDEVLKLLAEDDKFVETLLVKLTVSCLGCHTCEQKWG